VRAQRLIQLLYYHRHLEQRDEALLHEIFCSLRLTNTATCPLRLTGWSASLTLGAAGLSGSSVGAGFAGSGADWVTSNTPASRGFLNECRRESRQPLALSG
jgi:hypothetical protein